MIVDKWGTVKSTILFGAICAVAGVLNAVSEELYVMLAARFLLGVGAEPLIVAITCALAKWFKGKELAFAFGVNLTIARLGSYAADLSPTWASSAYEGGWQPPLVVAAVIGGLCVVGAILYGILEVAAKRKHTLGEAAASDKLVISDLFTFSRSFWFITLLCVTFYAAIFPFRSFSIKYFIEAWDLTREVAGQFNSVLPLAADPSGAPRTERFQFDARIGGAAGRDPVGVTPYPVDQQVDGDAVVLTAEQRRFAPTGDIVLEIPDDEIWGAHCEQKQRLVNLIRAQALEQGDRESSAFDRTRSAMGCAVRQPVGAQHRQEGLLRHLDVAEGAGALLALFLLL